MSWAAPELLLLLWAAPLLLLGLWLALRARRRVLGRLGPLVDQLSSEGSGRLHRRRLLLLLGALVLGVVALAGPRWGYRWEELKREGLAVVVVLDVSSSMAATDVSPSRMERARRKVLDLADMLAGDRVGLVLFAGGAYPRMPLTLDYDALRTIARDSDTTTITAQGSDIGAAIDAAVRLLGGKEGEADQAILLISDGEDQVGDAVAAAERAAASGVHIYALGVGTPDGAPIPLAEGGFKKDRSGGVVLSRLDEDTLKAVARAGSGAYARASAGAGDLRLLYEDEIRGKLQTAEQGARREKIWDERYQWPLAVALLLGVVGVSLRPGPIRLRGGGAALLLLPWLFLAPVMAADPEVDRLMAEHVERPDDLALAERLGGALYKSGDYAAAEEVFDSVAARSPDPAQRARARYNSGLSAYKGGRLTEAVEDWQGVLEQAPEHAPAKQNLEAARKELAARLQRQPPQQQPQDQQGDPGDQGEQQDQQPQEQQDSGQQPEEQGQQEPRSESEPRADQGQQPQRETPESDGTREPGEPGEPGEADTAPPEEGTAEGAGDTGEAEGEPTRPGSISAGEADRLLEGVEEGDPRVVVSPRGRGGNDW